MSTIDWVEEASLESFPASDAPAWPDVAERLMCPPRRAEPLEAIAYHEAGHAVVGLRQGLDLLDTDILPDGAGGRGHTHFAQPPGFHPNPGRLTPWERDLVDRVLVTFLAGYAAEGRVGHVDQEGSGFDVDAAVRDWIRLVAGSPDERQAELDRHADRAAAEVAQPEVWARVETVARRLLERQRLDAAEVRRLTA